MKTGREIATATDDDVVLDALLIAREYIRDIPRGPHERKAMRAINAAIKKVKGAG